MKPMVRTCFFNGSSADVRELTQGLSVITLFFTVPANTTYSLWSAQIWEVAMWSNSEKLVAVVIVLIRNLSGEPEAAGQVGSLPAVGMDVDKDGG